MKQKTFLVPVVTPFNSDESVNYNELKKLVKKVLTDGADGLYVGGASSEFLLLTREERKKVLETAISAADGAYVCAHIGDASAAGAEDYARHAKKAGADSVASVPPFWFPYTFDEIKYYYEAIADASELPVVIYNIPSASKITFSAEQFYELFRDRRIFSVKYTDCDYYVMERIKTKTGAFIYSGSDQNFLSALAAGADGGIGTTFNFMMKKYLDIKREFDSGNNVAALKIMTSANNITEQVVKKFCLMGTKYILSLQGIEAGNCRRPFRELTEDEKKALKKVYYDNI